VLLHEATDEARIPQLRRDAQILAAPHQGVRLAPLGRRRDAVLAEVLLLATRLAYKSILRVEFVSDIGTSILRVCTFGLISVGRGKDEGI
jgi:hypothetical protein